MSLHEARILAFCGRLGEYPELQGLLTTPYFVFDVGIDWVSQYKKMIVDNDGTTGLVIGQRRNIVVSGNKSNVLKSSVLFDKTPTLSYYKVLAPKEAPMPDYKNCHHIRHLLILLGLVAYKGVGISDNRVKWYEYRCCFEEGTKFNSDVSSFASMITAQLFLESLSTFEKVFYATDEYFRSLLATLEFVYGKQSIGKADKKFNIDDPTHRSLFLAFAMCSSGEMSVVEEYIDIVRNGASDYNVHPDLLDVLEKKVVACLNKK